MFISRVIKRYNLTTLKQHIAEDKKRIKAELFDTFEGIKMNKEDWDLAAEAEIENKENEIDKKIIEACEETHIDPKNLKLKRAIRDVIKDQFSNISVRQVVLHCLAEKGVLNSQLKQLLNRKLKHNDYPTDAEIQKNGDLFYKLQKLRNHTCYNHYHEEFHNSLHKIHMDILHF